VQSRVVAWAVFVLVLPFGASAQSAFEVASVKANTTGNFGRLITYTADSLQATNVTLSELIQSAYGIREDRLTGGPSWVRTTRFDVNGQGRTGTATRTTASHGPASAREQVRRRAHQRTAPTGSLRVAPRTSRRPHGSGSAPRA